MLFRSHPDRQRDRHNENQPGWDSIEEETPPPPPPIVSGHGCYEDVAYWSIFSANSLALKQQMVSRSSSRLLASPTGLQASVKLLKLGVKKEQSSVLVKSNWGKMTIVKVLCTFKELTSASLLLLTSVYLYLPPFPPSLLSLSSPSSPSSSSSSSLSLS